MNKFQAATLTVSQVALAPWFSFWVSFSLSQSPFLALFSCLFAIPTAFYTSIKMIERGKGYQLLQRSVYQFRHVFNFEHYTDPVATFEYTTLWTSCLTLGSAFILNYLYALIPFLTGLSAKSWERWIVFVITMLSGAVIVPVYALIVNWILTDNTVKDLEKKDYNKVLAGRQYEMQIQAGTDAFVAPGKLSQSSRGVLWPSLFLILTSILIGLKAEASIASFIGLIAVYALFNLKLPSTLVSSTVVYLVALGLLLGMITVTLITTTTSKSSQPLIVVVLYLFAVLLVGLITLYSHPKAKEYARLYEKFLKGIIWGVVGVVWSLSTHNYPAFFSFLFSAANLVTAITPLLKRNA